MFGNDEMIPVVKRPKVGATNQKADGSMVVATGAIGAVIGGAFAGPAGAVIGAAVGFAIGTSNTSKK
jgi:hypothetical protein